jgi:hypothetical protein
VVQIVFNPPAFLDIVVEFLGDLLGEEASVHGLERGEIIFDHGFPFLDHSERAVHLLDDIGVGLPESIDLVVYDTFE